jgi:acetyl-CoA C-acetyltransferase
LQVPVPQGRGKDPKMFTQDEEPGNFRGAEKLRGLRPAFTKEGSITAANASKLNDGACAAVIMSRAKAEALGAPILASILGFADGARDPMDFTTAPAITVPLAMERAGVTSDQIDLHEINEAFAVVALANAQLLDIPLDKLNTRGGAIAMGHPIGCSGARIVATLAMALRDTKGPGSIGCASICNGGGGASAMIIRSE